MNAKSIVPTLPKGILLAAFLGASLAGSAFAADRSGQQVVEAVCIKCHGPGTDGAPKIGDKVAWSKRVSEGLAKAADNAIAGVRKMPAHGGDTTLTDLEMSRAIAYMVSGGHSPDPAKPYTSGKGKSGEQVVAGTCQNCHGAGKDGAPKIGDMAAWKPRLEKGLDSLVASAVKGHRAMPSRGGSEGLSDAELRAAVIFMVVQGVTGVAK